MKSIFKILCILSLLLVSTSQNVYAVQNFTTEYKILYTVSESTNTHAILNGEVTNITSKFYAPSYTLKLGFENIENVIAKDAGGILIPEIKKTQDGHAITLNFNKKIVGKDKKVKFSIEFDTSDVAKKQGNVWEINIPGIKNFSDITKFDVEIKAPESFGKPVYIKPKKPTNDLKFSKEHLGKSGISIGYGASKVFDYTLQYNLKNTNIFPITTEIALPPSTNYQKILIDSIQPEPLDVIIDEDGNWLAKYYLQPSEKTIVNVVGKSVVNLIPELESLSNEQRDKYLSADTYWESDNNKIQEIAKELKTPEAIYQYVVRTLNYDFKRVTSRQTRLGAVNTMNNSESAVCLEFTDLFIALSRSAGIPARELNGFAYTENAKQRPLSLEHDILHAWPEYYDDERKTWIMVDPTWGNTTGGIDYFHKFDLNHLTFVRKGADSKYPIPAGGYKSEEDKEKKDVQISFSNILPKSNFKLEVTSQIKPMYTAGLPIKGFIKIKNTGNAISPNQTIEVTSDDLKPHSQKIFLKNIPPRGTINIPLTFESPPFLTNRQYEFTMKTEEKNIVQNIIVSPLVFTRNIILGGTIFVILTIFLFIITVKAWRLSISRRRR